MSAERRRVLKTPDDTRRLTDDEDGSITSITVHYAEEAYSPVQYNTFRVGGHSVTVVPRVGESARDAYNRGYKLLEELADKEFEHRLLAFRERLRRTKGE